jgi:beta-xylosidase
MKTYYIYLTDLFCGSLNYSFVTKFIVTAKSERGAVQKMSRLTGLNFRHYFGEIYHSTTKLTGLVFDDVEYPSYDYKEADKV